MHSYQLAACQFIKDTKKCALFIDMGLGKSITTLTAILDLQRSLDCGRALVCGPPRVAKKTWPDEVRAWAHTRALTYTDLCGPKAQREKNIRKATDLHFISHDLLPWLDVHTCGNADKEYDVVIVDESSAFKSQKAKRWQALRRIVARARYVVLLTGTPVGNGLHNLWAQMFLIDGGARLGHDEKSFKERYFHDDSSWGEHAQLRPKEAAAENIQRRIEDVCFTLLDQDYAELPERIDNKVVVELDPFLRKRYKAFVRECVMELEESGTNINAISASGLTQKLQQFANGRILDAEKRIHKLHDYKLDALDEIVNEANGEPMIVVYSHQADRDAILAKYPYATLLGNNPKTQDDWNAGKIRMLVTHPKSVGHGLNLQHGGNILVWYGLTWSLELYKQTNKRLHRKGQKRTVVVHHILTEGTIDMRVMESLKQNGMTEAGFLNALRRIVGDEYIEATKYREVA